MRNTRIVSFVLLLAGAIFVMPAITNSVHALQGTVCIIPVGTTTCPGDPPTLTGNVGTQLRVSIFVQGSDATNGFDITLSTDHTVLKPAGADVSGTILPGPQTVLVECIGGVLIRGNVCSSTDTVDTIHFAVSSAPGTITGTPATGLLFTAIFNVTASGNRIPLGYQSNCPATTSVPNMCLTLANGTPTPDPENESPSTFRTSGTTGTVCIVPNGSTSCPTVSPTITGSVGSQLRVSVFLQGSLGTNGFDVTLLANHTILKPAGADFTGTVLPGPQTVLAECIGTLQVAGTGVCSSHDTVDTIQLALGAAPGTSTGTPVTGLLFTAIYNVTGPSTGTPLGYQTGCPAPTSVQGTCITLANGSNPDPEIALGATVTSPTPPNFSISANPTSLTIARRGQGTSTISLLSLGGFSGMVSLSTSVTPVVGHGPAASLNPVSVSLSSGGTGSSILTVSADKHTPLGTYTVTIIGTSGTISHTATVTVTVTR